MRKLVKTLVTTVSNSQQDAFRYNFHLTTKLQVHLKGLNGLRAIAAFSVVIMHTSIGLGAFGLPWNKALNELGIFAVTIFFSLSGFLITYLLLLEKEKHGRRKHPRFLRASGTLDLAAVLRIFVRLRNHNCGDKGTGTARKPTLLRVIDGERSLCAFKGHASARSLLVPRG